MRKTDVSPLWQILCNVEALSSVILLDNGILGCIQQEHITEDCWFEDIESR